MKNWLTTTVVVLAATVASASADPLTCNLAEYKAAPGLAAMVAENALVLTWDGTNDQELRLQFTVNGSTPTIRELAVRRKGGQWAALVTNATPDYRVATGLRRATDQQLNPLRESESRDHSRSDRRHQVGGILGCATECARGR